MKKQVFILASALLLASCGGSNAPAFSEKPGVPVEDIKELKAPLEKLSQSFASTKKIGFEVRATESIDASFRTVANADLGLKDATYPIKSSGNLSAKAGFDFENVKASASAEGKVSASAKIPSVSVDENYSASVKDTDINVPETSLSAKAYVDDNRIYADISGAKSGIKTILTEAGKSGLFDVSSAVSAIDEIPGKFKSPAIPEEALSTIKTLPDTIGQYINTYGQLLVSFVDAFSSMSVESGQLDLSKIIKAEKVDNDYRIALDATLNDLAPIFSGLLESYLGEGVGELVSAALKVIDAKVHFSITFNEQALVSVNLSLDASVKNLKLSDVLGAEIGAAVDAIVTDINLAASFAVGIDFKYGDAVAIEALSEADKANFPELASAE